MRSPLAERLAQRVRVVREDGFLVQSGSPARYLLSAEPGFCMSISAIKVLARRHVRIPVAKEAIECLLVREGATVDVPKVENAEAFERELAELKVRAVPREPEAAMAGLVNTDTRRK